MDKVFVVTSGSYSGYRIRAIFTTKKKAEAYKALFKDDKINNIETYQLNPDTVDLVKKGYSPWLVLMLQDGTVERIERQEIDTYTIEEDFSIWKRAKAPAYKGMNVPDCLSARVMARDSKHAIKIVNEHRTQMIATKKWK